MKTDKKPAKPKKAIVKTTIEPIKPSGLGESVGEVAQNQRKVGYKNPPINHQFKPGLSPNPGGKPVASRNKLQGDFLRDLANDFEAHGKKAIIKCREDKPDVYIKVIASLMPKELEITRPLDGLNEEELIAAVAALQSFVNSQSIGSGISVASVSQSTH